MTTVTNTALIFDAIEQNNIEAIKVLLENGADPNIINSNSWTPLYFACSRDNSNIVKLLLEHGADPNFQNNRCNTPLMIASSVNNYDNIMILIDYGADCKIINNDNKTAFDYKGGDFIREYLEFKEHQIVLK